MQWKLHLDYPTNGKRHFKTTTNPVHLTALTLALRVREVSCWKEFSDFPVNQVILVLVFNKVNWFLPSNINILQIFWSDSENFSFMWYLCKKKSLKIKFLLSTMLPQIHNIEHNMNIFSFILQESIYKIKIIMFNYIFTLHINIAKRR